MAKFLQFRAATGSLNHCFPGVHLQRYEFEEENVSGSSHEINSQPGKDLIRSSAGVLVRSLRTTRQVRDMLSNLSRDRASDEFVF